MDAAGEVADMTATVFPVAEITLEGPEVRPSWMDELTKLDLPTCASACSKV